MAPVLLAISVSLDDSYSYNHLIYFGSDYREFFKCCNLPTQYSQIFWREKRVYVLPKQTPLV